MHGVDRAQMRREAPHDRQPMAVPVRARLRRQRRPLERQPGSDNGLAALVEPGEELGQQLAGTLKLVTERPPNGEVLAQALLEHAHDRAPGHGRASSRSASRSTLA